MTAAPRLRNALYDALATGNLRSLSGITTEEAEKDDAPALRALRALGGGSPLPAADFLPLVRHLFRSEAEGRIALVRAGGDWPDATAWEAHGFRLVSSGNDSLGAYLTVQALPWQPKWLPGAERLAPEEAPCQAETRRLPQSVSGDPFLARFGFSDYRSEGQARAVRAVLGCPPGSALIINLPTAMGKSLCGHVLGRVPFLDGERAGRGVVVFVVPTVALALDQARVYAEANGETDAGAVSRYAYTGGASGNADILRRIRNGEQEIVFAAPEALTASLRPALYKAAELGTIKALVIDEAHIVDGWGDEFRPAFQEIAGLRRALMRVQDKAEKPRLRTLLLSATLTTESVATLQMLFGGAEPLPMVAAIQLRPEPAYWSRFFRKDDAAEQQDEDGNEDEGPPPADGAAETPEERRIAATLEAMRHLPRPLILYVTERREAKDWAARLRKIGYRRLDCMTGDTLTSEREKIIRRWTRNETDMVVATAAFGLGMDKGDVRAVIHACLPETLDRFYQEVGRGGRDGSACVSLLLYTAGDIQTANNLAAKRLIGIERGLPRWRAMFEAKKTLPDGRYLLDLRSPPGVDERAIDMVSERNEEWNARTLTLLQRTGIIELDDAYTPQLPQQNGNDSFPDQSFLRAAVVREPRHLDAQIWEEIVEPHRRSAMGRARQQREGIMRIARQRGSRRGVCVASLLSEQYQLEGIPEPARACGGCPHCRAQEREPFCETPLVTDWPWPAPTSTAFVGPELQSLGGASGGALIYYDASLSASRLRDEVKKLLRWALGDQRVPRLLAPSVWERENRNLLNELSQGSQNDIPFFVETSFTARELYCLPSLILCPPPRSAAETEGVSAWGRAEWRALRSRLDAPDNAMEGAVPFCLCVAPENLPDPENPNRRFRDMLRCPQYALGGVLARQRIV